MVASIMRVKVFSSHGKPLGNSPGLARLGGLRIPEFLQFALPRRLSLLLETSRSHLVALPLSLLG